MSQRRLLLEGLCDQTAYDLPSGIDDLTRVAYREWNAPIRVTGERYDTLIFEAPLTASYLRIGEVDSPPQAEPDAIRFLATVERTLKRPVWLRSAPNRLLVFPPPANDGDLIVVEYEEKDALSDSTKFIAPIS